MQLDILRRHWNCRKQHEHVTDSRISCVPSPGFYFSCFMPWHVQRRLTAIAPPSSLATNHFEWYLHSVRWSAGRSSAVRKWRELRFLRRCKDAIPLELTRRRSVGQRAGSLISKLENELKGFNQLWYAMDKQGAPKNGGTGMNTQCEPPS